MSERVVWVMERDQTVRRLTDEEIDGLPQDVLETLDFDCLAASSHSGGLLMYGNSPEHLIGTDGVFPDAKVIP